MEKFVNLVESMCVMRPLIMNVMYVFSIAFQLSAGLLLVGNTNISREGMIREYCYRHTGVAFNKDGSLAYDIDLKAVVKSSWINRLSFIYLFVGYLFSIFGEAPKNRWLSFIIIITLLLIIVMITYKIVRYKRDRFDMINLKELPLDTGVMFSILDDESVIKEEILESNK